MLQAREPVPARNMIRSAGFISTHRKTPEVRQAVQMLNLRRSNLKDLLTLEQGRVGEAFMSTLIRATFSFSFAKAASESGG